MIHKLGLSLGMLALLSLSACDSGEGKTRTVAYTAMVCTEIMYHPAGTDSVEFVELKATGAPISSMSDVNLRLDGAVYYEFPDEALDTNEYIVVTNDTAAFHTKYPNFTGRLFGPWFSDENMTKVGKLSNDGDVIEIKIKGDGDFDARFDDDPPWPSAADGNGSSLVYVGSNPAYAESWAASRTVGGNPGSGDDPTYAASSVRINEIMPYGNSGTSWIEFFNSGTTDADIGGWEVVRVDAADSVRYVPSGTTVPAGGYTVLYTLNTADGSADSIYCTARGEKVYLREAVSGALTGVGIGIEYSAVPTGHSAGVIELSDGSLEQGTLVTPTPGAKNSKIALGPIYVSELYYNPPDGDIEFLELVNKSDSTVTFKFFMESATNYASWKIFGIGFAFDDVVTLAPNRAMLLLPSSYTDIDGYTSVSVDTAEYRTSRSVPDSVQIFQYTGKLSNRGELVSVEEPADYVSKLYYRVSDAVLYSDDGLWPAEADGDGYSLNRIDYTESGYEPSNWEAAEPTPGKI